MSTLKVSIDAIRSLAFGGISGSYATVGGVLTRPIRLICFTNGTNGDVFFSTDGSTNMLFVAASSFKLFDLSSNKIGGVPNWAFPVGTQFSVKQSTMPTSGAVYIECLGGS